MNTNTDSFTSFLGSILFATAVAMLAVGYINSRAVIEIDARIGRLERHEERLRDMTDKKNPMETLREAFADYNPIIQSDEHDEILTMRVEWADERWGYIVDAVRKMLVAHAVRESGTTGGAVESYPLHDGRVFHVVWIGTEDGGDPSVLFNISPRSSAW